MLAGMALIAKPMPVPLSALFSCTLLPASWKLLAPPGPRLKGVAPSNISVMTTL